MDWFYHDGKNRNGPLNAEQFREFLKIGKITEKTLIWKSGMLNWKRWRDLRLEPDVTALFQFEPGQEVVVCQNCRKPYPLTEVVTFENRHICSNCKLEFIQRLKEGATLPEIQINASNFASEIIYMDYQLSLRKCLNNGFELVKEYFWLAVGAAFIVLAFIITLNFLNRFNPFLGTITNLTLSGPLYGGILFFFIQMARGKYVEIGNIFNGFKGWNFWQLLLGYMVPALIYFTGIVLITIVVVLVFEASSANPLKFPMKISSILIIPPIILAIAISLFFYTPFLFALSLIMDKKLNFWLATQISFKMVKKHWFKVFGLILASGILTWSGLIFFCIGVFFTLPIMYVALAYAYTDIFKG